MAVEQWNWSFFGFERLDGSRPVQDWFNGLPEDAKKEARNTVRYLQYLPSHLWKKPQFDQLSGEDVTEVRFDTSSHTYRIYGYYGGPVEPQRQVYTFVYGTDKKRSNDRKGKREASKRKGYIQRGEARVHRFEFYRLDN